MTETLIILAAGASSRMKASQAGVSLSEEEARQASTLSKSLISVGAGGRPLLDYLLYNARQAGYRQVCLVVGEDSSAFRKLYGEKDRDNDFHGLQIHYAVQRLHKGREKPYGTADALQQCLEQYPALESGSFVICNSDNLYSVDALKRIREHGFDNALLAYDREGLQFSDDRVGRFALMTFASGHRLTGIIEKPRPDQMEYFRDSDGRWRVSMNIFHFTGPQVMPALKQTPEDPVRKEKELPATLMVMLNTGRSVFGIPVSEHVPDLTSREDITILKEVLSKMKMAPDW